MREKVVAGPIPLTEKRSNRAMYEFKALRASEKRDRCEVCHWRPPIALREINGGKRVERLLHAHHIVPIACGGNNSVENLVLVCPNHHAIAHRIWPMAGVRIWMGPVTRADFLFAMLMLSNRQEYPRFAKLGHRIDAYLGLLEEEAALQDEIEVVRITRNFTVVRGNSVPLYGRRKL